MTMNPPIVHLEIRSVNKSFRKVTALQDVSLDIFEGEFLFLLGPSGCGKTTLLRILAGLEDADSGSILERGVDVTGLPPSRRNFGIVFQSYALFPNLTVAQNIAYGLQNKKISSDQIASRVKEMLEMVGLTGMERRYPAQLSGGQQQRVALARALAISPGLLLLDEPLSALDARVRANLRIEIASLQRRLGITTVMVTHDQEEALTMADRIVVMDQGKIVQIGTPLEIYQHPASPFVADFVGLMNFLPCTALSGTPNRVRCGGVELQIEQSHAGIHPDQPVTLAIRPEEVEVLVNQSAPNTINLRIQEIEFMGPFYRLYLHQPSTESNENQVNLTAYLPPSSPVSSGIQKGVDIAVHLPAPKLRVFPAGAVSARFGSTSAVLGSVHYPFHP